MTKNFKWLLLVALTVVACSKDDDEVVKTPEVPVTAGTANFAKYVALGNSLTAGYGDGALYKAGQEVSWTKILSDQFKAAGGGDFKIPFMNDNLGGLLLGGNQILENRLYWNTTVTPSAPNRVPGVPTTSLGTPLVGPFNNMGVPGAKSFHLLASGYGNIANLASGAANPYFVRFASAPAATVLGDAMSQTPTFFTLWIGNNDILSYATSGGVGNPLTGANPATYGPNDITNPAVFQSVYTSLLTQLTSGGAKGAVANIPNITTIPFFTTIKFNQLTQANLTVNGVNQVASLNAQLYGPLKNALTFLGQPNRINLLATTGNNPMIIRDESLTNLSTQLAGVLQAGGLSATQAGFLGNVFGQARQTTASDYIPLSTSSDIGRAPTSAEVGFTPPAPFNLYGITFPLQDKHVLIPSEVQDVETAATAYNNTISALATQFNLAFVDTRAILTQVNNTGFAYDKYVLRSDFVTGGAFSLDGVHPTGRGYALIANQFVKAINAKYGSTLREVKLIDYPILRPINL
jgi:lysophospholipase L1-like esterase